MDIAIKTYRARQTLIEMLEDRGHTIPEEFKLSWDVFKTLLTNKKLDIKIPADKNKNGIYIKFIGACYGGQSLSKKELLKTVTNIRSENSIDIDILILSADKPNQNINKDLNNPQFKNVEIFSVDNLQINITKHVLVPKHFHIKQGTSEYEEILKKYDCKASQLPVMSTTDPVARYYGMKYNDIAKILRPSESAGYSVVFRVVK